MKSSMAPRVVLWTVVAMAAFAANSVLCRLALGAERIDAASFTAVRLGAGALMLSLVALLRRTPPARQGVGVAGWRGWSPPLTLFLYAVCFSFAYRSLSAGVGALVLFGAVQVTMIVSGLVRGERPGTVEWVGLVLALGGLVYLTSPGLAAPPLAGSALMAVAGVSWGVYSLAGGAYSDPVAATTRNFLWSLPFAALVALAWLPRWQVSAAGVWLAVVSGALASGLGYVVWYAALRGLTATRAATVQLSVPVLAALGGVAFLAERITLRLAVASVVVLGGVGLSILGRSPGRGAAAPAVAGDLAGDDR